MKSRRHLKASPHPVWAVLAFSLAFCLNAQAQTFSVIHSFTGGGDGSNPYAGLTIDAGGNLYGTTYVGGRGPYTCNGNGPHCGTVFKLKKSPGGWTLNTLYGFLGGTDGSHPRGGVAIARDGSVFGATETGGDATCHCGTVYNLRPSASRPVSLIQPWNETVLYRFTGNDGNMPEGDLTFDASGDLYGTTQQGGDTDNGVIYEMSRAGGSWAESVVYWAQNNGDGAGPVGGVAVDSSGNLYGVFQTGGLHNTGDVFRLSRVGSGWQEQSVYAFLGAGGIDGGRPYSIMVGAAGDLFGTNINYGSGGAGNAFRLSESSGNWAFASLEPFRDGGLKSKLIQDSAGNLYGTTSDGGTHNAGTVYKLSPLEGGGWLYSVLYEFTGGADGSEPGGGLVMDNSGNLYGTTFFGGNSSSNCFDLFTCGVVFEITPN